MSPLILLLAAAPALQSITVPKGLPEAEVKQFVVSNLPSLAECGALARAEPGGAPEPIVDRKKADDLVKVSIGSFLDKPMPGAESELSAPNCIYAVIRAWKWPAQWVAKLPSSRLTFSYRFRPDDAALAATRAGTERNFEQLCTALAGAAFRKPLPAAVRALKLEGPGATELRDLIGIFDVPVIKEEQSVVFTVQLEAFRAVNGITRPCAPVTGWTFVPTRTLLQIDGRPVAACSERVKALRALTVGDDVSVAPAWFAPKSTPVTGVIFEADGSQRPMIDESEIARLAAEQVKVQKKPKPIVYLRFKPEMPLGQARPVLAMWGEAFEVRVLVAPFELPDARRSKTDWAEARAVLFQIPRRGLWELTTNLADDASRCAGSDAVANRLNAAGEREAFAHLGPWLADMLEGCGCPGDYAEVVWALASSSFERSVGRAGWIALDLKALDARDPSEIFGLFASP